MKVHLIKDDGHGQQGIELEAESPEELKLLGEIHFQIFERTLHHWGLSPRSYQFIVNNKAEKK